MITRTNRNRIIVIEIKDNFLLGYLSRYTLHPTRCDAIRGPNGEDILRTEHTKIKKNHFFLIFTR